MIISVQKNARILSVLIILIGLKYTQSVWLSSLKFQERRLRAE